MPKNRNNRAEVLGIDGLNKTNNEIKIENNVEQVLPSSVPTELPKNKTKTNMKINRCSQALVLPTICNLNPRSVYNKTEEFHTLVKEEEIDVIFMSESWERESLPLRDIIKLEDHTVISNVSQRTGMGGRPAL